MQTGEICVLSDCWIVGVGWRKQSQQMTIMSVPFSPKGNTSDLTMEKVGVLGWAVNSLVRKEGRKKEGGREEKEKKKEKERKEVREGRRRKQRKCPKLICFGDVLFVIKNKPFYFVNSLNFNKNKSWYFFFFVLLPVVCKYLFRTPKLTMANTLLGIFLHFPFFFFPPFHLISWPPCSDLHLQDFRIAPRCAPCNPKQESFQLRILYVSFILWRHLFDLSFKNLLIYFISFCCTFSILCRSWKLSKSSDAAPSSLRERLFLTNGQFFFKISPKSKSSAIGKVSFSYIVLYCLFQCLQKVHVLTYRPPLQALNHFLLNGFIFLSYFI